MAKQPNVDPQHCSICLDDPRDPRRLPCLHVYCRVCLEQLIERRSNQDGLFPCPCCRHEHTLPDLGVDAFPTVETTSESNLRGYGQKSICRLHNEERSMFCIKCKRPICNHCLTTTHKRHSALEITEFLRDRRKLLQVTLEEMKENISELNATAAHLKKESDNLARNKYKDIDNTKTQGKLMKDMVDDLMKEAVTRIEKEYMVIQNDLKDKLRIIQKANKDMQNYVFDVESIVANNERDQLFFGFEQMMQKKERLLSQKIDTGTVPIQSVFTKGSCDKTKLSAMFGTVAEGVNSSSNVKVNEPRSIFPIGPSLKPCLKNHVSNIRPGIEQEEGRNLDAIPNKQTAVRFLRNIKIKRYANNSTGLDNGHPDGQSLKRTSMFRSLPLIQQKSTIETGRLQGASLTYKSSNTPRLLRRLLNIHSKD